MLIQNCAALKQVDVESRCALNSVPNRDSSIRGRRDVPGRRTPGGAISAKIVGQMLLKADIRMTGTFAETV
jgi:hypothetical protein